MKICLLLGLIETPKKLYRTTLVTLNSQTYVMGALNGLRCQLQQTYESAKLCLAGSSIVI